MDVTEISPRCGGSPCSRWMRGLRALAALLLTTHAARVAAEDAASLLGRADAAHPRHSEGDIERMPDGTLLAVWTEFTGGGEDHATAQLIGRTSHDEGHTWGESFVVQSNFGKQNVMSASLLQTRHASNGGDLWLFFLVKNSNTDLTIWWRKHLPDAPGDASMEAHWTEPRQVPSGPGYHVMNNDRVIETRSGRILAPAAYTPDIGPGYNGQVVRVFFTDDRGVTWHRNAADVVIHDAGGEVSPAMEPGLIELADGRLMMIIRTKLGFIYQSFSADAGGTWSPPEASALVSPAAPASIARIPTTNDLLIIWNNVPSGAQASWNQRNPLTAAISGDDGATWGRFRDIETTPGESFAYTSIMFADDSILLTHYVHHQDSGWIDQRCRRHSINWLYGGPN